MRKIEITLKDFGKYVIQSESYDVYSENSIKMSVKPSLILNKVIPLNGAEQLTADMLNKEEYFHLRGYVDLFTSLYVMVNVEKQSSIEHKMNDIKKNLTEDGMVEDIVFLTQ